MYEQVLRYLNEDVSNVKNYHFIQGLVRINDFKEVLKSIGKTENEIKPSLLKDSDLVVSFACSDSDYKAFENARLNGNFNFLNVNGDKMETEDYLDNALEDSKKYRDAFDIPNNDLKAGDQFKFNNTIFTVDAIVTQGPYPLIGDHNVYTMVKSSTTENGKKSTYSDTIEEFLDYMNEIGAEKL